MIFITETDVLSMSQPMYVIERMIRGSNTTFQDGSHIIYVNSSMMDLTTPLGRLMHDFHCTRAADMYYDVLAERVRYLKETEGGTRLMSEAMENFAKDIAKAAMAQGMEQGMEQGMAQGKTDIVLEMLRGKMPIETIAHLSKFSLERVRELGKMHSLL